MDTFTQIALGAGVGEAVLGRQVGRRALLWGGLCGLLPDLDVLVRFSDPVKNFTYHRGPSHSLFVLALMTPVLVALIQRVHPQKARFKGGWTALVYLAFATHVILDCFTVYGTQIFWPLKTPPVMGSTIFIIDPAYSLPLMAGVMAAVLLGRSRQQGRTLNTAFLALSTVYLVWSIGAKYHVTTTAQATLKQQNITYDGLLTVPAPFNTLLWRILAMDDGGYYEGFYSLLDKKQEIRFRRYASDRTLIQGLEGHWPIQRLKWFTHGFYSVGQNGNDIVMTDLRMGLEPDYVFRFKVGEMGVNQPRPTPSQRLQATPNWQRLKWVWQRIWTADPEIERLGNVMRNRPHSS